MGKLSEVSKEFHEKNKIKLKLKHISGSGLNTVKDKHRKYIFRQNNKVVVASLIINQP